MGYKYKKLLQDSDDGSVSGTSESKVTYIVKIMKSTKSQNTLWRK